MEYKRNIFGLYQCPCCEYFTLEDVPDDSYEICPVCNWEVDNDDEFTGGGANPISLIEAREIFKQHKVSHLRRTGRTRNPTIEEQDERIYDEINLLRWKIKSSERMYYPPDTDKEISQKGFYTSILIMDIVVILSVVLVGLAIYYFIK